MSDAIVLNKVFTSLAITQNTAEEAIIRLYRSDFQGFFSLQIGLSGAGNVDITYAVSNDGSTYITPAVAANIFTAFDATSGPGSDGDDIAAFSPMVNRYLKIIATEQNAGAVVLDAWLAIQ